MQGPEESAANPTPETACIVGSLAVVDASLVAHSGAAGLAVAAGAGRPGAPVGALLNKATATRDISCGGGTPVCAALDAASGAAAAAAGSHPHPQSASGRSKQQAAIITTGHRDSQPAVCFPTAH